MPPVAPLHLFHSQQSSGVFLGFHLACVPLTLLQFLHSLQSGHLKKQMFDPKQLNQIILKSSQPAFEILDLLGYILMKYFREFKRNWNSTYVFYNALDKYVVVTYTIAKFIPNSFENPAANLFSKSPNISHLTTRTIINAKTNVRTILKRKKDFWRKDEEF